jgi:hypothetical protein
LIISYLAEKEESMETSQETAVVPKIEVSPLRRSAQIGKLIEALAKAGTEFGEITKDTENPYFKSSYADLATLIKHTRPALAKYGLVILQLPRKVSYEEEFDQRTADQVRVKPFQVSAFLNTCTENGKTIEQIASYLKTRSRRISNESSLVHLSR